MSPDRRVAVRRRRITALVVLIAVAATAAVIATSGSGNGPAGYRGGAPGSVRVVGASRPALTPHPAPAFHPAASASLAAARLTLAQQVAQLFIVSFDGTDQPAVAGLGSVPWGGVLFTRTNFASPGQVAALAADVAAAGRIAGGPPPLLAAEQPGGPGTAFPGLPPEGEAAVGASGRPALEQAQAQAAGQRLRAMGFRMTIAPLADVDVVDGALSGQLFSADPHAVARFALAAARGFAAAGMLAAAAHFPGEGGASADPDRMTATVGGSLTQIEYRDAIPFVAIVRSVPVIVMSNAVYAAFDGVTPASLLPSAVSLLRRVIGFGGVVMSDDLDATLDPTGESPGQVALQALRAGDDLLYISGPGSEHLQAYNAVLTAARQEPEVRRLVHAALLRDLMLKVRAGLLLATTGTGQPTARTG